MKQKRYAGIIVRNNNKVLLCKRNNKGTRPGEWSIPGGNLNEGENPAEGAMREFYEETHHEVSNEINLVGVIERYTRDGSKLKGMMYVFLMDENEELHPDLENASDGDEHTECGYFGVNELPSPIGEKMKSLIEIILKK